MELTQTHIRVLNLFTLARFEPVTATLQRLLVETRKCDKNLDWWSVDERSNSSVDGSLPRLAAAETEQTTLNKKNGFMDLNISY